MLLLLLLLSFFLIIFFFCNLFWNRRKGAWCTGRLGLTDLRLPLMWKDTDHFKNRGDYRRFAVFCLAKVGTEVLDSSLVTPVDRAATDITFADSLVLSVSPLLTLSSRLT